MPKGRKADRTPNKVMTPNASKTVRNPDGSLTLTIPFNDEYGERCEQTLVVRAEGNKIAAE